MGVGVKVGFKYSVGVLHRLGGEGCNVGKGNEKNFRAPSAPPYVWPVVGGGGVAYPNRGDGPPVWHTYRRSKGSRDAPQAARHMQKTDTNTGA